MPVCLHCGELASDGALFCAKCGYTLPQTGVGTGAPPLTPGVPLGTAAPSSGPPPPAPIPAAQPAPYPPGLPAPPYVVPVSGPTGAPPPGISGPIPPPPSGKYCVHCRTIIARAAAYCPVCQQPQS